VAARNLGHPSLPSSGTAPLKPTEGLNGPPAVVSFRTGDDPPESALHRDKRTILPYPKPDWALGQKTFDFQRNMDKL